MTRPAGKALPAAGALFGFRQPASPRKNMGLDIDEITFGSSGQITLTSKTITASLGTADRLKDKLLRLSYILPKVQDEAGVLHFEDYTEDNTDIVFQKTKSK